MTERVCVPEIEKKITPNTWLTEGREKLGLDRKEFGNMCGCSELLITWLEEGTTITHPLIAAAIVRRIGGNVEQYNRLVHPIRHTGEIPKVRMRKANDWKVARPCDFCGNGFIPAYKEQRFCSRSCGVHHRHARDNA